MSTTEIGGVSTPGRARELASAPVSPATVLRDVLALCASLKLTVVLFALSIVLVLAGTLAQRHYDIWYVVNEYFRTGIAWIELRAFVPERLGLGAGLRLPFPGGWLIGAALSVNLLAAHAIRFKFAAQGRRLAVGLALLGIGVACTYAVIFSGLDDTIESELSPRFCNGLWHALRASVGGATLALAYALAQTYGSARASSQRWFWRLGAVIAGLLAALTLYLFLNPDVRINDSGLRIMWQLVKATGASLVLWAGCWLAFAKRAGVVLLHGGIGLMMFSELYTGLYAVESRMQMFEGESRSYAEDIRSFELVFTDKSAVDADTVVTIPGAMIQHAAASGEPIRHDALPMDLRVVRFLPNADARLLQPGEETIATRGIGQLRTAYALSQATGVDQEQRIDVPAAYVELLQKDSDESAGVLLAMPFSTRDMIVEGDGRYELTLRFKRISKPYTVRLKDAIKEDYVGSDTPKNYESVVQLQDPSRNVDQTLSIWMNNPLRYAGDTLYQSGFDTINGADYTVLQVVSNSGWMIPYVSCMIVATGMLAHFGAILLRFVRRRDEEYRRRLADDAKEADVRASGAGETWTAALGERKVWIPAVIVAIFAFWIVGRALPARDDAGEMRIQEFGKLPIALSGRTQPMDSLARNTLRLISGYQTFEDDDEEEQPAIRWLLDVMAQHAARLDHRVLRIENLEVQQLLDLPRRKGFRYSLREVLGDADVAEEFHTQVRSAQAARETEAALNLTQRKFLELDEKVRRVNAIALAFDLPDMPQPSDGDVVAREKIQGIQSNRSMLDSPSGGQIFPRAALPLTAEGSWETLYGATLKTLLAGLGDGSSERNESAVTLVQLLLAYRDNDVLKFNSLLTDYQKHVQEAADAEAEHEAELVAEGASGGRKPAERLALERIGFEAYFNHLNPFVLCIALYISAFVLASLAFLIWPEGFNRSANWLLWMTFVLHSYALLCRIYISGRPPVTNLYSSAVFIGWGAVLFALIFEMIYRFGIGNLLAAAVGFPTMVVAYYLTFDANGDTFGVMQAVLDTNFWLATHVVCISLGYTTTFLAGALGLATILLGRLFGVLDDGQRRQLTTMTYGVCFAMFFSFVGTVLGGLWADDSWGRFWGWDPKENGALMIVLWNALVLHARWGRMIGERGLAVLVVFGNIVTAWSWFGVNQLGIGLHSYGFSEGLTMALVGFVTTQLIGMAAAALPPRGASATA